MIGLVIGATDTDGFVYALPTAELFERVFALAGFTARVVCSKPMAQHPLTP